ncbi:MAG: hypothetical protein ACOYZ6_19345 [Chloroflexota bacterium]
MKQTLTTLLQTVKNTYDGIRRLPQLPAAYLHPWRRDGEIEHGIIFYES